MLGQQGAQALFALGEVGLGDLAREFDAVDLADLVEDRDGGTVPKEDALCVDSARVPPRAWAVLLFFNFLLRY